MGQMTSVDGNRVTIDGEDYIVKPAGTDRYGVSDDFGGALGYFALRGKAISADGPGSGETTWPASTAARTSRAPGSETPGVPAS